MRIYRKIVDCTSNYRKDFNVDQARVQKWKGGGECEEPCGSPEFEEKNLH